MPAKHRGRDAAQANFPATLAGARSAREWLEATLQEQAVGKDVTSAFAISLMELATNIVDHCPSRPDAFRVRLSATKRGLKLELTAQAQSFAGGAEFQSLLQREVSDVLAERGRGLIMVGHFFPDASYEPPGSADEPECYVLEYACGRERFTPTPAP